MRGGLSVRRGRRCTEPRQSPTARGMSDRTSSTASVAEELSVIMYYATAWPHEFVFERSDGHGWCFFYSRGSIEAPRGLNP